MEFMEPLNKGFTIYTKSGCQNCTKTKKFLQEKNFSFTLIDSDNYLIEEKDNFLSFIKNKSNSDHKTFPIIFHDGIFIGGYQKTVMFIDKLLSFGFNEKDVF
jgi:glutaredoxin